MLKYWCIPYLLIITIVFAGCEEENNSNNKQPAAEVPQVQKSDTQQKQVQEIKPVESNEPEQSVKTDPVTDTNTIKPKEQTQEVSKPKVKIADLIKSSRKWIAINPAWHGRPAPDFTLLDIKAKTHKLSDYKGKNVMLVFWATWCGPCRMEIPHLIELRNMKSPDQLAILAITNEKPEKVKEFVQANKINYTVLLDDNNMPAPYGVDRLFGFIGIPASFFIDPEGKIKLAVSGTLSIEDIKAILEAE